MIGRASFLMCILLGASCAESASIRETLAVGGAAGGAGTAGTGGTPSAGGAGGSGGSPILDAAVPPDAGEPGCADFAKYIYLVANGALYRFDPLVQDPSAFHFIGQMDLPMRVGSMSVDRQNHAWILKGQDTSTPGKYDCAGLTEVSLDTGLDVKKSTFSCGSAGFDKFGMGFVTDSPGGTKESLFLANVVTPSLGRLEPSGEVTYLGALPGSAELTGNANGELWGFFPGEPLPSAPTHVRRLDKTDGSVLEDFTLDEVLSAALPLGSPGMPGPLAGRNYAFAYWGGAFYLFFEYHADNASSDVWKISATGEVEKYIEDSGLHIVGAGVSTCAPTAQPR